MIRFIFFFGGILSLVSSCGTRRTRGEKMQEIPLSVVVREETDIDHKEDNLEVSIPVAKEPSIDSKPLTPVLVIFRIQPEEMAQHVPVRTYMPALGEPQNTSQVKLRAYPAPTDLSENSTPIALNNGYFLDRSGFIDASSRFLDVHFDAYQQMHPDTITTAWLTSHLIPSDVMQFEWWVCDCDRGDAAANVKLLNSMINKGIESFKHPQISTQIHPRFGAEFPKN